MGKKKHKQFCVDCWEEREGQYCSHCRKALKSINDVKDWCQTCKKKRSGNFCNICSSKLKSPLPTEGTAKEGEEKSVTSYTNEAAYKEEEEEEKKATESELQKTLLTIASGGQDRNENEIVGNNHKDEKMEKQPEISNDEPSKSTEKDIQNKIKTTETDFTDRNTEYQFGKSAENHLSNAHHSLSLNKSDEYKSPNPLVVPEGIKELTSESKDQDQVSVQKESESDEKKTKELLKENVSNTQSSKNNQENDPLDSVGEANAHNADNNTKDQSVDNLPVKQESNVNGNKSVGQMELNGNSNEKSIILVVTNKNKKNDIKDPLNKSAEETNSQSAENTTNKQSKNNEEIKDPLNKSAEETNSQSAENTTNKQSTDESSSKASFAQIVQTSTDESSNKASFAQVVKTSPNAGTNKNSSAGDNNHGNTQIKHNLRSQTTQGYAHRFPKTPSAPQQKFEVEFLKPSGNNVKTMTIQFYACINSSWTGRVLVYAGEGLGNWRCCVTEMKRYSVKHFENNGEFYDLLSGEVTVDERKIHSPIPYKYFVIDEETGIQMFEFLYTTNKLNYTMNRKLFIPKDRRVYSTFHQFDDIILQPPPSENDLKRNPVWKTVYKFLTGNSSLIEIQQERGKIVARHMLMYYINDFFDGPIKNMHDLNSRVFYMRDLYFSFFDSYSILQTTSYGRNEQHPWKKLSDGTFQEMIAALEKYLGKVNANEDDVNALLLTLSCTVFIDAINEKGNLSNEFFLLWMKNLSVEKIQENPLQILKGTFNNTILSEIHRCLIAIWKTAVRRKDILQLGPYWCYPLVIMHGLSVALDTPKKFTQMKSDEHLTPQTSGLYGIELHRGDIADVFSETFLNLNLLENSLKSDKILQRSLVYVMDPKYFKKAFQCTSFQKRLLIRAIISYIKKDNRLSEKVEYFLTSLVILKAEFDDNNEKNPKLACLEIDALVDLLILLLEHLSNASSGLFFVTIQTINSGYKIVQKHRDDAIEAASKLEKKLTEKISPLVKGIKSFTYKEYWGGKDNDWVHFELQILRSFLQLDIFASEGTEKLQKHIFDRAKEKLERFCISDPSRFLDVYLETKEGHEILPILEKVFENNVERFLQEYMFVRASKLNSTAIGGIMKDKWDQIKIDNDKLIFCFTWHPMKTVVKYFWQKEEKNKSISNIISYVNELIISTLTSLFDSSITFKSLDIILTYKLQFFEFVTIFESRQEEQALIKKTFVERANEYDEFKNTKILLNRFVTFFRDLLVSHLDIRILKNKLQSNEEGMKMSDVYHDDQTVYRYFDVEEETLNNLKSYHKVTRFSLFHKVWKRELQKPDTPHPFEEFITDVFIPAIDATKEVLETIANESITTDEILEYIEGDFTKEYQKTFEKDLENLASELKMEVSFTDTIKKLKCVIDMDKCINQAESILNSKNKLGLNGDFSTVEKTVYEKLSDNDLMELVEITTTMIKDVENINTVTKDMERVFEAVTKNLNILKWLRDNLKDPKEVKVFVEMMSIAAGESDYEVDRVAYFEATCQAFGPIIFELPEDSGHAEFDRACRKTGEYFKTDDNIIDKLNDSNRNIEWFKKAKQSQGSVAARSLLEANKANKNGTYTIGNLKKKVDQFVTNKATLSSVIKLEIPYEERERVITTSSDKTEHVEMKTLYLDDIHDLQSRLMLLGREKREDVDDRSFEKNFFVKQAEMVTALGTAFVSLVEAGNVNFLGWCKEWQSDVEKAKLESMDDFLSEIRKDVDYLNHHLQKWRKEVMVFREKYPIANFYTIKQCLVIQKYLFECSQTHQMPIRNEEVFYLLQCISYSVSTKQIKDCLFATHADTHKPIEKPVDVDSEETNFTRCSVDEIKEYLSTLDELDIDKSVALASLVSVDISKVGRAIIWCKKIIEEDDDDKIEELRSQAEEEMERQIENMIVNDEPHDVQDVESDEIQFFPLEQFGRFLKEFGDPRKKRVVPEYLNKDKPSLVTVPRGEVYPSLLAMYDNDGKGSLPEADEVLICSGNVSTEQIQLLIMRAVYNEDGGLYCLAFADDLDYETSETTFTFLQKLLSKGKMNPLVIMCCSENENNSSLVSLLETYRIPFYHNRHGIKQVNDIFQKSIRLAEEIQCNKDILYGAVVDEENYNARVVTSSRGGMGKSLFIEKRTSQLDKHVNNIGNASQKHQLKNHKTVIRTPVHGTTVNFDEVVANLSKENSGSGEIPRVYHFDVAPTVYEGLDELFFNVIILGFLQTSTGKIWRKQKIDICFVEFTDVTKQENNLTTRKSNMGVILKMLPQIECASPKETFQQMDGENAKLFHTDELSTQVFQRVVQYLQVYKTNQQALNKFTFQHNNNVVNNPRDSLEVLLRYCGVDNPSWMELWNFVHFFNQQLIGCERSIYTSELVRQDFPGFKSFVINFLLEMARDFATRSLSNDDKVSDSGFIVELKRTWEQSSHPYLFFNEDDSSMTFFGINVSPHCHLVDQETGSIIRQNIMEKTLYTMLHQQMSRDFVNLSTNYSQLSRERKICILCRVMGLPEDGYDPDPTYELTIDNMKKILAIHMRLRCGVPVVLMGETGCGKTTLIRFMSALRAGQADQGNEQNRKTPRNMVLVKVHGGITMADIVNKVEQAQALAQKNVEDKIKTTTLFLDEANTSDAIGLIKEVMVDKMIYGEPLGLAKSGLEVIAACNPYRKHTDEMIEKLESAGLGYHVGAVETYEKIGEIPLRQLVYRVHPLPESMKPLVWDFGQLNATTEEMYAKQIIARYEGEGKLPRKTTFVQLLIKIFAVSQQYMRKRKDECSFVSLRDVERAVQVTAWFYKSMGFLLPMIRKYDENIGVGEERRIDKYQESSEKQRRSLVLALGVCYVARLEEREDYVKFIVQHFTGEFALEHGADQFKDEIEKFQKMFVNQLKLEDNIAKNQALCENVFMMVICIELRIPLFVVGKPGSSKSLAKTIVQDNMQGNLAKSELFKNFKQVFMSSYQCSPLSTADGIIGVFKQSARFQEGKNLDEYTSVVVLDEVGLAEDSPRMPLKALHPLLEDGTDGSEDLTLGGSVSKDKRVAFIGISNWALDPAKMNRGIMLCRSPPTFEELVNTARDIGASDKQMQSTISPLLRPLAKGYMDVYNEQKSSQVLQKYRKEEFFGLRDFYSLVKMVFCYTRKDQSIPPINFIEDAVKRNFSGMDEIDAWSKFKTHIVPVLKEQNVGGDSRLTTVDMIKQCFEKDCPCSTITGKKRCTSNRYLLVMTEKYSALPIIEGMSLEKKENMSIIFGSSFPKDQEFTQVCRDINRIKMCMETGKTVVLLNMENLYESLYDALNQYYVYLGGQRYVDLGLGTHRVKCRVHEDFKLIVIADKEVVYNSFPIPLINRLEKHYLVTSTAMTDEQRAVEEQLKDWAKQFAAVSASTKQFDCDDAFIGFTEDTCASIAINMSRDQIGYAEKEIFENATRVFLQISTPEAIARLEKSKMEKFSDIYYKEQQHLCLSDFLTGRLQKKESNKFIQVTTFSRLLTEQDLQTIKLPGFKIHPLNLVQFQTEHSFREAFKKLREKVVGTNAFITIQYSVSRRSGDLVPCAQHICKEIVADFDNKGNIYVLFLLQLNRGSKGLVSYQPSWECVHIDEMRQMYNPTLVHCTDSPISSLFDEGKEGKKWLHIVTDSIQGAMKIVNEKVAMETDMITQKINTIINLLNPENDIGILDVVLQQIRDNLIIEERKQVDIFPEKVNNWVPTEAKELKYTPGYGTFGAALSRCVEEKVSPILAALIIQMDVNDNLMLLNNGPKYEKLWVTLFQSVCVVNKEASDGYPMKSNYTARFPFSHNVMAIIDEQINQQLDEVQGKIAFDKALKALHEISLGQAIKCVDEESLLDYSRDFVSSKYAGLPSDCVKVLAAVLYQHMNKFISNLIEEDISDEPMLEYKPSLPAIHYVYKLISNSVDMVAEMLRIKPDIAKDLENCVDQQDVHLIALHILIRSYLPIAGKQIDVEKVIESKNITNIVNSVLNDKIVFAECKEQRILWTKLKILQIYVDDVNSVEATADNFSVTVMHDLLTTVLHPLEDAMESLASWESLEMFTKRVVNEYQNRAEEASPDDFKERFLQFFVDVVTEFCFSKSKEAFSRIEQEVIIKIMGYAFHSKDNTTKCFSPLEEYAVDQSPVIRSFILQQLLKKEIDVSGHLNYFLEENFKLAMRYNQDNDFKDFWNICKIFVSCYEDHLSGEANLTKNKGKETPQYLQYIANGILNATAYFNVNTSNAIDIEMLENIALIRMCISAASTILCSHHLKVRNIRMSGNKCVEHDSDKSLENHRLRLFANLMKFITNVKNSDAHMFLIRQIVNQYGQKELRQVIEESYYKWIDLQRSGDFQKDAIQDRYLVYGDGYKEIRDCISELHLHHGNEETASKIKQAATKWQGQPHLHEMALLHYEVFSETVFEDEIRAVMVKNLNAKHDEKYMQLKNLYKRDDGILELLYHFSVVVDYSKSSAIILFRSVVNNAGSLQGCYLPTMPSDNFDVVRAVLPSQGYNQVTKHECPNGHPYVIVDCGNPNDEAKCPDCGALIGGGGGRYAANRNRPITHNRDTTKPGYCIGLPNQRPVNAIPERSLSPVSVTVQRLLLHFSMLLGSVQGNKELIAALITPAINIQEIEDFLTGHIQQDLFLLGQIFDRYKNNDGDKKMVAHLLLKCLMENNGRNESQDITTLKTKEGRDNYENFLDQTVVTQFLNNLTKDMDSCKELMMADTRIGENPLIKRLYEVELPSSGNIKKVNPLKCYQLWSYRQPITIPHLKLIVQEQNVLTGKKSKNLLSMFLEQDDILVFLKDLPRLQQFQNILYQHFSFKVDKKTAMEETLGQALPDHKVKMIRSTCRHLSKMWKDLLYHLKKHGRVPIPKEYQVEVMNMDTPLAYFLPTIGGPGACFMALIDFLAFKQNEIITQYNKIAQNSKPRSQTISLLKLKESDVINYLPDRDLLPLIFTNCDYSLEIGKGTKISYNLDGIQKHLIEKLCFGKPMIEIQMKEFVYRDDIHNARKFTNLGRRIKQVPIPSQEQRQMMNELTEIIDVSHSLYAAEIAIGFLSTTITRNDPEMLYHKYLQNMLKMDIEKYLPSRKMRNTMKLKNLTSMWLMLTIERAIRLDNQQQDLCNTGHTLIAAIDFVENPFECESKFMKELHEDLLNTTKTYLRHVEPFEVVSLLTEYIVCGDLSSLPDNALEYSLKNSLEDYEDQNEKEHSIWLETFPDTLDLHLQHIYALWREVAALCRSILMDQT